ncbi:hypothetical protein N7468_006393 [Penicillium chermesinum]|uniref:Dolichol-phosphate mannosyltransferase subunit 3 n=1 Tax=Penicillium chermesinum TaxID=63820 RepID=A0A9W9TJM2_9EURO|nr:uncharacterized protein N7468_006393 [Penicillium chermesinum]KAJ5225168.1 hypothetical protein N7468_006393 [Penicillium chermesinum]KAJ6140482.1 hypothetical protein N7470_010278 [Penicillium chermesinum]
MTRAQQTLSVLLLVSSLYLSLYLGLVPLNETIQTEIIPVVCRNPPTRTQNPCVSPSYNTDNANHEQLPFWGIIVFGCYLLGRLGIAIFTFNDVPEAHAELQKEIEQAKIELRQGKVDVD